MEMLKDRTKEQLIKDLVALRRRISELEKIEEDKKKYEAELNRTEAMFEGLFEFAPDAILVINHEGRIIRVNNQMERLFGYSRGELLVMGLENLLPERFREIHEKHRQKYLAEPRVRPMGRELELYGRRKDGSEFHVDIALGPLKIEQDFFVLAVIRDFTEFKRTQEELVEARDKLEIEVEKRTREIQEANVLLESYVKKLEASNTDLEEFAYVASHDLQEPLRKIKAFGDILGRKYKDKLDEDGKDYIDRMRNAANRMQELVRDLLKYSRVGTRSESLGTVDLKSVVTEAIVDLDLKIERAGANVKVSDLPSIEAEKSHMRQLFQNLIANALKFHREEKSQIKISSRQIDHECSIFVEDNGIGFDEQYLDRIFMPFQRLHGRSAYDGTGMGLAICRKIVERYGGRITANSKPGEGSTFIITFPCH